jgi:hypothetical protein
MVMPEIENLLDAESGLRALWKKPGEVRVFDIDVGPYVRDGAVISTNDISTVTNLGKVSGSGALTAEDEVNDGAQRLQFKVSGGTDLENYRIKIPFVTDAGSELEADVILYVREDPADIYRDT